MSRRPKAKKTGKKTGKKTTTSADATTTKTSRPSALADTTPPPLPDALEMLGAADGPAAAEAPIASGALVAPESPDSHGHPLTWPLEGEEARREWQSAGEMGMAQADWRLQQEAASSSDGRTVVLAGMGSYLGVEGISLVCHQGRTHGAPAPARELLYPALHGIRHIIWIGGIGYQGGTLTLPAVAWCRREGISLTVLDGSGEPLMSTWPDDPHDAQLKQRQWAVHDMPILAAALARELLRQKIDAQAATLAAHCARLPGAQRALEQFKVWQTWLSLPNPPPWQLDVDRLRQIEARLARHYFNAWENWDLPWAKTDVPRLPPHWLVARERSSPLAPRNNARHSVDPLNSTLNYGYGCLASQCRQSLIAAGLDVSCGYLHSDQKGRDSLTWDLVELGRAQGDHLVLSLLARTTLHRADFAREQSGQVMLHPQIVRVVLATCRLPQAEIDGHARWLADWLRNADQTTALSAPCARHDDGPAE